MQLPQVFHSGAVMDGLPCFRATRLVGAVIHDGSPRVQCIHNGARIGQVEAVMRGQIKIHCPDGVGRAHQCNFLGLGQVAQVEEAELAEADQNPYGPGVLCVVRGPGRFGGAQRIGHGLDVRNGSDVLPVGGQDHGFQSRNVDCVSGMDDAARLALDGRQVGGIVVPGNLRVFAVGAVVEEFADTNALHQLRHTSHVVVMIVGDEHMV